MDEELRAHIEHETAKLVASGLSHENASRAARLAIGGNFDDAIEDVLERPGLGQTQNDAAEQSDQRSDDQPAFLAEVRPESLHDSSQTGQRLLEILRYVGHQLAASIVTAARRRGQEHNEIVRRTTWSQVQFSRTIFRAAAPRR